MNKAEKNYSITKRELLAVIFALKQYRQYVLGLKFTLRTDHEPLRYLTSLKDPPAQMGRWLDRLQDFTYTVEHRPGSLHGNADGLSRQNEEYTTEKLPVTTVSTITQCKETVKTLLNDALSDIDWATEQANDTDIGPIYMAMKQSSVEPTQTGSKYVMKLLKSQPPAATESLSPRWPMLMLS